MHFHTHIGGGDEESFAGGLWGDDLAVRYLVGSDEVRSHIHIHEAMGEHDLSGFMCVISHHADRGVGIGSMRIPEIGVVGRGCGLFWRNHFSAEGGGDESGGDGDKGRSVEASQVN